MVRVVIDDLEMWTYSVHMKSATLRDLRNNFSKLEVWLAEGEQIRIEKRGCPIALLTGLRTKRPGVTPKTNFAARRKAIWGKRVFSPAEVAAMRADDLEGEEG